MENYSTLCEQARSQGYRVTGNMSQWLEWRANNPSFQQDPLDLYLERMRFFRENLQRAANRDNGWDITIEEDDCYRQGAKQNWLCAITRDSLQFSRGGQLFMGQWSNPWSASLDRIDPERGYLRDNLQLVTWQANYLKNGFTMSQLQDLVAKAYSVICQNH